MSPWEVLYKSKPDITHLRTFGCACFPLLRPYNTHKLQPHTKPCIFLGYPAYSKGYICLEPSSNRIFITRNVLFNELEFLYHEKSPLSIDSSASSNWVSSLSHVCQSLESSPPSIPTTSQLTQPSQSTQSRTQSTTSDPLLTLAHVLPIYQPPHLSFPHLSLPHSPTLQCTHEVTCTCFSTHYICPICRTYSICANYKHFCSISSCSNQYSFHTIRSENGMYKPKAFTAIQAFTAKIDYTELEPPNFKIAVQYP